MTAQKRICSIFKSPKKQEMYLYVDKKQGLEKVPEELIKLFGQPLPLFDLLLTPTRKLAREDVTTVLNNIELQGFHLQMPPPPEENEDIIHWPEELLRLNDPQ